MLLSGDFDSVFPVVAFSYPVWRGVEIVDGKTKMVWPEYAHSRSQDLKTIYHDAGQWYWLNPDLVEDAIYTSTSGSIVLEEREVQDIDTLEDWTMAELKHSLLRNTQRKI